MQTQFFKQKIISLSQAERRVLDQLGIGNTFKDSSLYQGSASALPIAKLRGRCKPRER